MPDQPFLGEFEMMVLLTIHHLGENAYGVPLARELAQTRGREVAIGSVYAALERLESRQLVASHVGESTPERGGRAKRYFRLTQQGLQSIHETRTILTSLWQTLPPAGKETA